MCSMPFINTFINKCDCWQNDTIPSLNIFIYVTHLVLASCSEDTNVSEHGSKRKVRIINY